MCTNITERYMVFSFYWKRDRIRSPFFVLCTCLHTFVRWWWWTKIYPYLHWIMFVCFLPPLYNALHSRKITVKTMLFLTVCKLQYTGRTSKQHNSPIDLKRKYVFYVNNNKENHLMLIVNIFVVKQT